MLTVNTQFEQELKKRIQEEVERVKDIIAAGMAVKDYADYRFHVGRITALRDVADSYCAEVTTKISQR